MSKFLKVWRKWIWKNLYEIHLMVGNVFSVERFPRPNSTSNLMWKLTWLELDMIVNFAWRVLKRPILCQNMFPFITDKKLWKNKFWQNHQNLNRNQVGYNFVGNLNFTGREGVENQVCRFRWNIFKSSNSILSHVTRYNKK